MGNYCFILRAQMRAFTPLARAMASDSAASPDSTAFVHLQHSLPTKRSVWGSARQYICITSHPKADGLFFCGTRLGCRFAMPSLVALRQKVQTDNTKYCFYCLWGSLQTSLSYLINNKRHPLGGICLHFLRWAVDEAWTRDLFLTKVNKSLSL